MKKLMIGIITLLLTACSQLSQISMYSVSEQQLENMLSQQLPKLTQQANVAGIPLTLSVQKMAVQIGPDNSEVVRIDTSANAVLSLFGLNYPANMQLKVEGTPYYDASQKAIYVRSVKLLDSNVEAAGYRGNLAPVSNHLLQLVNSFLANNPVYRLDTDNPTIKLLTAVPIDMSVQNGRIAFTPSSR